MRRIIFFNTRHLDFFFFSYHFFPLLSLGFLRERKVVFFKSGCFWSLLLLLYDGEHNSLSIKRISIAWFALGGCLFLLVLDQGVFLFVIFLLFIWCSRMARNHAMSEEERSKNHSVCLFIFHWGS